MRMWKGLSQGCTPEFNVLQEGAQPAVQRLACEDPMALCDI